MEGKENTELTQLTELTENSLGEAFPCGSVISVYSVFSSEIRWDRAPTCPTKFSLFQGVAHDMNDSSEPHHHMQSLKLCATF
jgi:hypothetical protein